MASWFQILTGHKFTPPISTARLLIMSTLAVVASVLVYLITPPFWTSPRWTATATVRAGTMPTVSSIVSQIAEFEPVEDLDTLAKRLSKIPDDEISPTIRVVTTNSMSARIFVTGKGRAEVEHAMAAVLHQFKMKENEIVEARQASVTLAVEDIGRRAAEFKAPSYAPKDPTLDELQKLSVDRLGEQRLKLLILSKSSQPPSISEVTEPKIMEFRYRRMLLSLFAAVAAFLISLGVFTLIGRRSSRLDRP